MKIFYILSLITFTALQGEAQSGSIPDADKEPVVSIIKLYPNPATSFINFDFQRNYDKSYNICIFSFVGKKVYESNDISPKTIVNLTDFYRGIYIFQLRDKSGKVIDSGKFRVSK